MLNFCRPLMRGGGLLPEVWCDAGGDFALPITSSVHDLLFMLHKMCSFSLFQNLYLSTSTRCIKMGIESLKSAILYSVGLYFCLQILTSLRSSGWQECHLERPQGVERSKSCKYNKYPEPPSIKTALFMDDKFIFPFPSTKTAIFMDGKRKSKVT